MIIVLIKFVLPVVLLIFLLGKMLSKDNRKSKLIYESRKKVINNSHRIIEVMIW